MSDASPTVVTRAEFYLMFSTAFLSLFLVHMSASFFSDSFLHSVFRVILLITLLGLQLLCVFFSMREYLRRPK